MFGASLCEDVERCDDGILELGVTSLTPPTLQRKDEIGIPVSSTNIQKGQTSSILVQQQYCRYEEHKKMRKVPVQHTIIPRCSILIHIRQRLIFRSRPIIFILLHNLPHRILHNRRQRHQLRPHDLHHLLIHIPRRRRPHSRLVFRN